MVSIAVESVLIFLWISTSTEARRFGHEPRLVSFGKLDLSEIKESLHETCHTLGAFRRRCNSRYESTLPASVSSSTAVSDASVKRDPIARIDAHRRACIEHFIRKIPASVRNKVPMIQQSRDYEMSVETFNTPDSESTIPLEIRLNQITKPLIPEDVWESLTGKEFQENPEILDDLAETGAWLAENDEANEWVDWKVFGSLGSLKQGDVQVWTGKAKKEGHGSEVPFVKSRCIIPMLPEEIVDLLLDSDRVTTYNQWSQGRTDCWVAPCADTSSVQTKIVKSRTQPPLGAKPMVSVTLLHARPWGSEGGWMVVSRSPGGNSYFDPDDSSSSRSDILLGVNLLQPLDDESCVLTSVTHVFSPAVPAMLAERLGARSAIKFAIDIRNSKVHS